MRLVRRLYDWVLHWAQTVYSRYALFLLAVAESSFFPIPPDVLLLAIGLGRPAAAWQLAFLTTVGSVLGGLLGYALGSGMWELIACWFYAWVPGFTPAAFLQIQSLFEQYNFWIVFLAGFTPIPYKVFTIGAGVFNINLPIFLLASSVSRGLRFYLIAWVIQRYGDQARELIERHFNKLTLAFGILLVGGFIVIRYLF